MASILLFLSLMFENSKNLITKSFIMKKLLLAVLSFSAFTTVFAQTNDVKKKTDWSKIDLSNRANDHFMIQYGMDGWTNAPDSAQPSGFSRHFNMYAMLDKPFKTDARFSIGVGLGISSSNMFFSDTYVNLKAASTTLPFTDVSASNSNRFKKFKMTTVFVEVPLELRYAKNPITPDKGFKAAVGLKVGSLLKAYTKGKDQINAAGTSLYGTKYVVKEASKNYINSIRLAATGRIGFGNVSLDGSYQLTSLIKTGNGPKINPYSVGLTLSGL